MSATRSTFGHLFGGLHRAEARRWQNPDGSQGGIVAVSAQLDPALTVPSDCVIWPYASIGDGASIGCGASIGYRASIGCGASIGYRASIGHGASIGRGASIGHGASIGRGVSIGYGASIGYGVSIGYGASIGDGASIGRGDWWVSGGPCGSRNAFWTAVYSVQHGLRWWIGCQQGIPTEELLVRIDAEHGSNEHAQDYRAVVAFVRTHPGLKRANGGRP